MLLYRIETCVSVFTDGFKQIESLGPYGTRSTLNCCVRMESNYSIPAKIEAAVGKVRSYLYERQLFGFEHEFCNPNQHPAPYLDETMMENLSKAGKSGYRGLNFAFSSIEQLSDWFDDYARKQLHINGYYIAVYDAPEAYPGDKQCVFNKETAELVSFVSCLEV